MITPNRRAHQSPRDRMRQLAVEMSATADRSHLEPITPYQAKRPKFSEIYQIVKAFFLAQGQTLDQWFVVTADHKKFNRVWRQSLGLSLDDTPPPSHWQLVLPALPLLL